MAEKKPKQPMRDSWNRTWEMFFGLHWVWKILIAAPIIVTGTIAINTMLGTAATYRKAWIGDLPAANREWVEREIGELKLVGMQQDLYFCQQQNSIWDQKLKQARYDKEKGQRGYIDEWINTLQGYIDFNNKIIEALKKMGAPSSEQRCK